MSATAPGAASQVFTIGHSDHGPERFADLLGRFGITLLADVRAVPRSRTWPHFRTEEMAAWLRDRGIGYAHIAGLGGWRRARPDSRNGAWHNASFRGYADYALTEAFAQALGELEAQAALRPTAIMCSEALWWRCHRRLIADRLVAGGWEVLHISSDAKAEPHGLSDFGVVEDGRVVYPGTGP